MSIEEGRALRDAAIEQVSMGREQWVTAARNTAVRLALPDRIITSEDVRQACPIPDGCDPRVLGAVFRTPPSGFEWERVGYAPTRRVSAHARPIAHWRLVRKEAA